jgi:CRP-like cAMP-binding protein
MENDAPYRDAQPHVRSQKGGPSGFKNQETARENRLLATLPPMAYKRLLPHLKRRFIEAVDILHEAGSPIERIYFIESGVATLGVATENGGYTYIAPSNRSGGNYAGELAFVRRPMCISPVKLRRSVRRLCDPRLSGIGAFTICCCIIAIS